MQALIEALIVLSKYTDEEFPTGCEHAVFRVYVDPEMVSAEDAVYLAERGFEPDPEPNISSREMLKRRFEYRDLAHFLETWVWKNQFLREYEDFRFIAEAVASDLASQNIRYAEDNTVQPGRSGLHRAL